MNARLAFRLLLPATLFAGESSAAIESLAREIVSQNPELRFYEAELDAARASSRAAASRENPELSISAGRKRIHDSAGLLAGEGTAWFVSLTQTFDWPGRLALRKAIANRDVALAELGLDRFRAALLSRARTLSFGLAAAREKSDAAGEVADRFRALKETFLSRDPAGLTPLLETRVIEAQELALQRRATDASLAAQSALVELNQLRGVDPLASLDPAPAQLVFTAAPPIEDLLAAARENHFELRAKQLELEQQGFVVRLARNQQRPSISVGPFFERESATERETTIGLGVSVPLPFSSRNRAEVDAAESRRRQAETALLVATRDAEREVLAAAQEFSTKLAEIQRWSPDSVEKFREAAELADRHYRLGAVPLSTYVELQTAYLDAVDALLDTQLEALDAALRLQLLTGLDLDLVSLSP